MKFDSLDPPGLSGEDLGNGSALGVLDDATEDGGGEYGKKPPA